MGSRSPEGPCLNQLPHKISRLGHKVASGPSPAAPMATDGFPPGCEASYTVPSAVLGNAKTPGAGLSVRVSIYITWGFSVQPPPPASCSQDITVPRSQPPEECASQRGWAAHCGWMHLPQGLFTPKGRATQQLWRQGSLVQITLVTWVALGKSSEHGDCHASLELG